MEILYYKTTKGYVPVKVYLEERYGSSDNDNDKTKKHKSDMLAKLNAVIENAANNGGIVGGTFSSPIRGYSFSELRIKDGDELVRVLYFPYQKRDLVLLNAYDKPERYEKGMKKRVVADIEARHIEAKKYHEDFIENPNQHEEYKYEG